MVEGLTSKAFRIRINNDTPLVATIEAAEVRLKTQNGLSFLLSASLIYAPGLAKGTSYVFGHDSGFVESGDGWLASFGALSVT